MCKSSFWLDQLSLALAAEKCVNPCDLWHLSMGIRSRKIANSLLDFTDPSREEAEIRELRFETLINVFSITPSILLSRRVGLGEGGKIK